MSVGPLSSHRSVICGNLTITLTDGNGNIKSVQSVKNLVSMAAYQWMASAVMDGTGVSARYIYVFSGAGGANPSQSQTSPFSAVGTAVATAQSPLTGTFNLGTFAAALGSWAVSGTYTFSGQTSKSSVDGAALECGVAATNQATVTGGSNSWFAAATFAPLAITSVDKLSFVWAFSLSGTTSA